MALLKLRTGWSRFICLAFIVLLIVAQPNVFGAYGDKFTRLIASDQQGLTVEIFTPTVEILDHKINNNTVVQTIEIPGFLQSCDPGKPQLPVKGILFGMPFEARVNFQILNTELSVLNPINLAWTPRLLLDFDSKNVQFDPNEYRKIYDQQRDPAIANLNQYYPPSPLIIDSTAIIRDQRVGRLLFYPIQYNPITKETRLISKIKIRIFFEEDKTLKKSPAVSILPSSQQQFDKILQSTLINFEQSKHWRKRLLDHGSEKLLAKPHNFSAAECYKIIIDDDGIYRIGKQQLEDAGFQLSAIVPQNLQLYNKGKQIPIFVYSESDSVFDDQDYIEFYGCAEKTPFTNENIYWLTAGDSLGKRMVFKDASLTETAPIVTRFLCKKHYEENLIYYTSIPDGAQEDHWFWKSITAPGKMDVDFYLKDVVTIASLPCNLSIELRGVTHTPASPDHHAVTQLNGKNLLNDYWDGQAKLRSQQSFFQGDLQEGNNSLCINLPGDTEANVDIILVNWFQISYWRYLRANNDLLMFDGKQEPGSFHYEMHNYSTQEILIFDISDSSDVNRLVNFDIAKSGEFYRITLQDSLGGRRFLTMSETHTRQPKTIIKDNPSYLLSKNNQADYLIISHPLFYNHLAALASLRQNQGLKVLTVNLEDIYDEFNHGIKSPQAIKDFLSYTFYHWRQPAPTYVLLVGDASYDYKNYLGTDYPDLTPTYLFESNVYHTETSTDNWFVCLSGNDVLPEMLIGRLPVRTQAQLDILINKIISYEIDPKPLNLTKKISFVADNADEGGNFEHLSDYFAHNYFAPDYSISKFYLRDYGNAYATRQAFINDFNKGCLVTNYLGHGSLDSWAAEKIFTSDHVKQLNNNDLLPFIVTMSCLNGFFHHATVPYCLSEEFLYRSNGGAIASLSPSGFGYTVGDRYLGQGLYSALFRENDKILGSAVAQAKISIFAGGASYHDHIQFFNFLGDPALQLNLPDKKFTVYQGWNLISLPMQPQFTEVDSVLSSISSDWQKLMAYNRGIWTGADKEVPSSFWTLSNMKPEQGYWLQSSHDCELIIQGAEKSSAQILEPGWNLIGYPAPSSQPISDALNSIADNWSKILYYQNGAWLGADANLPASFWTLQTLEPGAGYWLRMNAIDTLIISRVPARSISPQPDSPLNQFSIPATSKADFKVAPSLDQINNEDIYKLTVPLPTGFYGFVTVRNAPAPVGTKISAWINGIKYYPEININRQGQYNLLLVSGDDPKTEQIEGGSDGDVVRFKITLTTGDTLISETRGRWKEGKNHRLDLFALSDTNPTGDPWQIQFLVNEHVVGQQFLDGDPIPAASRIEILITNGETHFSSPSYQLFLDSKEIDQASFSVSPEIQNPNYKSRLSYDLETVSSGLHRLQLKVSDIGTMPQSKVAEITFRTSTSLQLERIVNFPNPMSDDTKFTYYVLNNTPPAEVSIKIYTVAGRLIKTIESASNRVGYNETYWDGKDEFGDDIANGVYFYKIQAKDGSERTEIIEKLVKMK
ncbi:MAG TPA: T9SS type A sorting domain-containing protein [bacterium]|nr:T9SS type A sorting domain-containing protein [bacterium]